ncbi:MAG: fibrobacter succinogenes major paralogous domain-containing protein [Flavobacteriales bacterium]|nr:fibrobacter succinogenes major paralogous domain-containing protein [Flavobacteriales bacterium]
MYKALCTTIVLVALLASCKKDEDTPDPAPTTTPTPQCVADIDGNRYDTLSIGGLTWFTENLRVRRFKNGDSIPYVSGNAQWLAEHDLALCSAYQNDEALVPLHGLLYTVAVVQDPRGVCPEGWHPSTDDDWKQLESHLGMPASELDSVTLPGPYGAWRGGTANVGGKLKSTTTWDGPNTGADNSSGFNGLSSGEREFQGIFANMGEGATFWSAYPAQWMRGLSHQQSGILRYHHGMGSDQPGWGHSCRCVKD